MKSDSGSIFASKLRNEGTICLSWIRAVRDRFSRVVNQREGEDESVFTLETINLVDGNVKTVVVHLVDLVLVMAGEPSVPH